MIKGFADKRTETVFKGDAPQGLPAEILSRALSKLLIIHTVATLNDLRQPPGNRLEKLSGNRDGQHSIRINDQWRICFEWRDDNNAYNVEIADYH
jgi:proteic killer suppression protein